MKILLISTQIFTVPPTGYGGLEGVVFDEVVELVKKGHKVSIVCPTGSDVAGAELIMPCEPSFQNPEGNAFVQYQSRLDEFDVVHDHSWAGYPYLWKEQRNPNLKLIHTIHSMQPWGGPPPVKWPCLVGASKYHAELISSWSGVHAEYCVTGDTTVLTWDGRQIPIKNIVTQKMNITIVGFKEGKPVKNRILEYQKFDSYEPFITRLHIPSKILDITSDNRILTEHGWLAVKYLRVGDKVYTNRSKLNDKTMGQMDRRGRQLPNRELCYEGSLETSTRPGENTQGSAAQSNRRKMHTIPNRTQYLVGIRNKIIRGAFCKPVKARDFGSNFQTYMGQYPEQSTGFETTEGWLGCQENKSRLPFIYPRGSIPSWVSRWGRTHQSHPDEQSKTYPPLANLGNSQLKPRDYRVDRNTYRVSDFPRCRTRCQAPKTSKENEIGRICSKRYTGTNIALSYCKEETGRASNRVLQPENNESSKKLWREGMDYQKGIEQIEFTLEPIIAIEKICSPNIVYDLMTECGNFIANNVVIHNCYHGIDLNTYKFKEHKEDYLLYVARVVPFKGAHEFVSLCRKLGVRGYVVGEDVYIDREHQPYVRRVMDACDGKNVIYMGRVARGSDLMVELMQGAMALVCPLLPPYGEIFGLTTIEGMACGTPIVSTDRGATKELIVQGKTGYVVPSVNELADAVRKVSKIEPAACRRRAEMFPRSKMASDYVTLFERVLAGNEW